MSSRWIVIGTVAWAGLLSGCSNPPTDLDPAGGGGIIPFAGTVSAGDNQIVGAGATVELAATTTGFASPDLGWSWRQVSGPEVVFSGPSARPTVYFAAPGNNGDVVLEFQVTVTDGTSSASDTVTVTVFGVLNISSANVVAQAGGDREALESSLVQLSAAGSSGMNSTLPLETTWTQLSGPAVTLSSASDPVITFIAPAVSGGPQSLTFELEVAQGGITATDTVTVTIVPDGADAPCGEGELADHPTIVFEVLPDHGASPLAAALIAQTTDGSQLPSGPGVIYNWNFGGNNVPVSGNSANRTHVFDAPGIYTVSLCVTQGETTFACTDAVSGQRERQINAWPGISGRILQAGTPVEGVVVAATNVPGGAATISDDDGNFTLNVPYGWSGVLTPNFDGLEFNPPFVALTGVVSELTNINFLARPADAPPEPQPDECATDTDCDDGSYCNGAESCIDGACVAGTGPCPGTLCDETADTCYVLECTTHSDCSDGVFCNGSETCNSGFCNSGAPPCTGVQLCSEAADACVTCLTNTDCNDGVFCNGSETCVSGACVGGNTPCGASEVCDESTDACADPDECTVNADCADGLFCNGNETCNNGTCVAGVAPCAGELCDDVINACVDCLANSDCSDGLFCNGNETCQQGACVAGPKPCDISEICDEVTNECDAAQSACTVNGDCDDGLYCNGSETCNDGVCVAGSTPCTAGQLCNESNNTCSAVSGNLVYVDDNGSQQPGYNPSGTLGSINRPYTDVQDAYDAVGPGDTVIVRAGIYDAGGTSNNSRILKIEDNEGGQAGAPITVRAQSGERPILDGQANGTGPHHLVEILGAYVILDGFELRNVKQNAVLIHSPAHHVTVRNCIVHDFSLEASTRAGIMAQGPVDAIVIEDNLVRGYGGVGIFLDDNGGLGGNDKVPPNGWNSGYPAVPTSQWNAWPGYAAVSPKNCTVQRNVVYGMNSSAEGSDGIALNYAINCTIRDNVVFSNYDDNIDGLGATRCTFANNICFWANPGVAGGDGNGIKIGVRGALSNTVNHNICFENSRAGIDMTLAYRSLVYNNTCVNNEWRGISYGDTAPQMQENPSALQFKNNLCFPKAGATPDASFAIAKSAATDTTLMSNQANAVSDNNSHGGGGTWSLPLGTGSLTQINPSTTLPGWLGADINTTFPAGLTIPQMADFIRNQVYAKFEPGPNSPTTDAGVAIPGITDGFTGGAPDIGALDR